MEERKLLRIWLSLKTMNRQSYAVKLQNHFGTIENIYNATRHDYLEIEGIRGEIVNALSDKSLDKAKQVVYDTQKYGIDILTEEDKNFPKALLDISEPCSVIYKLGELPDWDNIFSITVVGTRKYDEYGQTAAERISSELAKSGVTIISGMASGIDTFALRSALRIGAPTVAVMGCGLERAYPDENWKLMNDIIKTGCAISEYPPYMPPKKENFPKRNRIMCALGDGILAVQSPKRSGTHITCEYARDMGKPVFAVPGSIFNPNCEGTNNLIKQGASAVTSGEDILEHFPIRKNFLKPIEEKTETKTEILTDEKPIEGLSDDENKIISLLRRKDMNIEEIAARGEFTINQLNGILPILEIEGYVKKMAGNNYKYKV